MDLKNYRKEFTAADLSRNDLDTNPFRQFEKWFHQADESKVPMPNSMTLATVSAKGQPSVRIVLLKYFDEKGFVFFTNYESNKAIDMAQNPNVGLLFFWPELERQIKITGKATKIATAESASYFLSRPRGSQIGAWVSNQSEVVSSRQLLRSKFEEVKQKFKNKEIPLPSFWGGYKVVPESFEFWQGQKNRLHDRFYYSTSEGEDWKIDRLAP